MTYSLNILLASSRSKTIGLGHFSRMLALRNLLAKSEEFHPYFSILGDIVLGVNSKNIEMDIVSETARDYFQLVRDFVEVTNVKLFIMDFHESAEGPDLLGFLIWARAKGIVLVAVDSLIGYREYLDHIWLPSIYFDLSKASTQKSFCDVSFGWDHLLLARSEIIPNWQAGGNILVMTGGSDVLRFGGWLPKLLDTKLASSATVNWVKGPYATPPNIPINPKLKWNLHDDPKNIDKMLTENNYVLTLFGVSFFESIQYGIPTVVVPLDHFKNRLELDLIKREKVALVADDILESVDILIHLMGDDYLAKNLSETSKNRMRANGCELFVSKINQIMSALNAP